MGSARTSTSRSFRSGTTPSTVRDHGHVTALEQAALAASTGARPHRGKERRPPSPAALAHAATLRAEPLDATGAAVIDLRRYAAAAHGRNTLTPPSPATWPESSKETNHQ